MAIEPITRVSVLSVLTIFKDWFVVLPQYPEPFHQSARSSSVVSSFHTQNLQPATFSQVWIFTTKLMDTFSVSFFIANDSTINTHCSVVNFISVNLLSTHAIYCTAVRWTGVTPCIIWSYVSHLREMLRLNEEDCADWWKGSGYWGKTTNQSSTNVKTFSTGKNVIASIAVDELHKVSHNLFMRCEACLQAEGGPFQHLL
jgi:hypothetical protein